MSDNETNIFYCTNCENEIQVVASFQRGGLNDYGGVIVECKECKTVNDEYIGRDIGTARVISGGKLIETWDKDVSGDRNSGRSKHGLPPI